jgi:hypothetical protein
MSKFTCFDYKYVQCKAAVEQGEESIWLFNFIKPSYIRFKATLFQMKKSTW